jgi:hypothetical protein
MWFGRNDHLFFVKELIIQMSKKSKKSEEESLPIISHAETIKLPDGKLVGW